MVPSMVCIRPKHTGTGGQGERGDSLSSGVATRGRYGDRSRSPHLLMYEYCGGQRSLRGRTVATKTQCRRGGVVTANILVADAEDVTCILFAAMLRQYGYQVVTTTDGRQIMDLLRNGSFDVVLLDIHMPTITGQDVLQQITQAFEGLPIICVTGYWST